MTIQTSRTVIRRALLVQLAALVFIAISLLANWASAKSPGEPDCERRPLANDLAGQYVVTCESGKVTAPSGTARRSRHTVRRVVGSTTIRTYTRLGTTTIVARLGARSAS